MDEPGGQRCQRGARIDPTLCTVRNGALIPGAARHKTLITANRSTAPQRATRGLRAKRVLTPGRRALVFELKSKQNVCPIASRSDEHAWRMGTSYVLSAARATADEAGKRALLQTFRDALSHAPDRAVVSVNCGTAVAQPRNMLLKTAFYMRYQAGGRSMACRTGSGSRAAELFFEGGDTTSGQSSIERTSASRFRH
jgi:hypothetical protein